MSWYRETKEVDDYGKKKVVTRITVLGWVAVGAVISVACIVLLFGVLFVGKGYSRYQKRQDANNRVKVTNINIRNAQQEARVRLAQVKVTEAEAKQRVAEAHGIRLSQDLIARTLTPLYVQHEAIKAQERLAKSPAHTQIYVPSGPQGIPLVRNTSP